MLAPQIAQKKSSNSLLLCYPSFTVIMEVYRPSNATQVTSWLLFPIPSMLSWCRLWPKFQTLSSVSRVWRNLDAKCTKSESILPTKPNLFEFFGKIVNYSLHGAGWILLWWNQLRFLPGEWNIFLVFRSGFHTLLRRISLQVHICVTS